MESSEESQISSRSNIFAGPHRQVVQQRHKEDILVFLGYGNKNTIDEVAETTNIYFSHFWRLGHLKSRWQQIRCLVRSGFLFHRQPFSHYVLTLQKGFSRFSLIRALIPLRAPSHNLITSQRPHFQMSSHWVLTY